ncbi:gp232 [Sphingomonas phage PAU]|uniref:gp232 n=1 Tax=Sphingomonas phage PAU TaxID=1150991 RepID=UPI0002573386|nr:gp232 [Sphingomonas phage PAU]AFF28230.1 gp232 [Sphingomonas phage PAU]
MSVSEQTIINSLHDLKQLLERNHLIDNFDSLDNSIFSKHLKLTSSIYTHCLYINLFLFDSTWYKIDNTVIGLIKRIEYVKWFFQNRKESFYSSYTTLMRLNSELKSIQTRYWDKPIQMFLEFDKLAKFPRR